MVVNKATPTITWPTPAPITPGTPLGPAQLNAAASTAGTFAYSPAAGTVLPVGTRTLNVTFTPTDSANYNSAAATVTQLVNEKGQAIYFPPIADRWYRDTPVLLGATASSGLPVSYTVVSGPAAVSGSALAITGPGRITVRASQGGSADWEPAEDVVQSFVAGYRTEVRASYGVTVWIDDAAVAGGAAFIWEPGTTHRIAALAFQSQMPGSGYRFASWSDGGAREHTITAAAADANAVELGVRFQSDVAGVISGIRFYKGSTNTGTHTGTLWSNTGTKLATATFTNETASGWQEVSFATPVATRRGIARSLCPTSACTSSNSGRVPSSAQATAAPASPSCVRPKTSEGSGTPTRPAPVISKTPTSFVEPKRFFTARRMRCSR
jgi:hypothetical protein